MSRPLPCLVLFVALLGGCIPQPDKAPANPPKAPAKAKAKGKPKPPAKAADVPLRVMASDIGPANEGKLVELTGKKTDARERLFQGQMWIMITVEDGNFEKFNRVAAERGRFGGYLSRSAKRGKIRIVGRVVKDNNEWVLVADQIR